MLFQLFLSIFAVYAVLYDVPNEYLFVPLLCLVAMSSWDDTQKLPQKKGLRAFWQIRKVHLQSLP